MNVEVLRKEFRFSTQLTEVSKIETINQNGGMNSRSFFFKLKLNCNASQDEAWYRNYATSTKQDKPKVLSLFKNGIFGFSDDIIAFGLSGWCFKRMMILKRYSHELEQSKGKIDIA